MTDAPVTIWMPVFTGDWMKRTMHLDTTQFGALMLLAFAYWDNGGPLPNDNQSLATICKMEMSAFKKIKQRLATFFVESNGYWRCKWWDDLITNAKEQKARRVSRAKHAANARYHGGSALKVGGADGDGDGQA